MKESDAIIARLRALKPVLQQEMGITRLRVFGSVARGEAGPESDVDLIADFDRKPSYFRFLDMRENLSDKLGAKVDLFTEDSIHRHVRTRVLGEAQDVWQGR